jgi:hypothetical protein
MKSDLSHKSSRGQTPASVPQEGQQTESEGTYQLVDQRPESRTWADLQGVIGRHLESSPVKAMQTVLQQHVAQRSEIEPIQLKTEAAVKQELRGGGILSNFAADFINSHLGLGANNNIAACKIHAARAAPPDRNTVVMDARALKTQAEAGQWTSSGSKWKVDTANQIALQSTRKLNAAINPPPAAAVLLNFNGDGQHADKFSVAAGVITEVEGATNAEVAAAVALAGAYPASNKKPQRRAYRTDLVNRINSARRDLADTALVNWVKAEFRSIGGTAMHGNAAITTVAHINAVATRNKQVEVYIGQNSGDIYHFHREF